MSLIKWPLGRVISLLFLILLFVVVPVIGWIIKNEYLYMPMVCIVQVVLILIVGSLFLYVFILLGALLHYTFTGNKDLCHEFTINLINLCKNKGKK